MEEAKNEKKKMKCYKRLRLCGAQFLNYLLKRFSTFIELCTETPYWFKLLYFRNETCFGDMHTKMQAAFLKMVDDESRFYTSF